MGAHCFYAHERNMANVLLTTQADPPPPTSPVSKYTIPKYFSFTLTLRDEILVQEMS